MDPMDWLEADELLRFFRCHKTEMSCMENPHTFLNQLRDHDLVPEDRYKVRNRSYTVVIPRPVRAGTAAVKGTLSHGVA